MKEERHTTTVAERKAARAAAKAEKEAAKQRQRAARAIAQEQSKSERDECEKYLTTVVTRAFATCVADALGTDKQGEYCMRYCMDAVGRHH